MHSFILTFVDTGRAMSLFDIIIVIFIVTNCSWTQSYTGFESNYLNGNDYEAQFYGNNIYLTMSKYIPRNAEKVNIQIFYECLCPCCKQFDVNQLSPVLETMNQYLNIYTYPYGNAKTIEDYNGNIDFKCQHGALECYGNKLHACALDNLEHTTALRFNICLMNVTEGGSDDNTADECGQLLGINPEGIKACAKGNRGTQLLQYYGEESKKANFRHVPYILINGKEYNVKDSNFKAAVCAAFTDPPPACRSEW